LHRTTIHRMKGGVKGPHITIHSLKVHHKAIHSMKGGVRLYITKQYTQ